MGCVVAATDDCVLVVRLTASEGVGVTAALAVAAMREIKVTARRKSVTSLLPRALQRCVRTRVLSRGDIMFPDCSIEKAAALTAKVELQLVHRLLSFFAMLLSLCYLQPIMNVVLVDALSFFTCPHNA